MNSKPKLWVWYFDLHWPKSNKSAQRALFDFLARNPVDGFGFGGDQFDNQCISKYTKGKPLLRKPGAYKRDETTFDEQFLKPLESLLSKTATRVWVEGNHDNWESQVIQEQPEFLGLIDRIQSLGLKRRGWTIVPRGRSYRVGKLNVIHGEILTGIGNQVGMYPARKAVEIYAGNVLAGHTHQPQSFTRVSPVHQIQKWMGWIAPVGADCNPGYLQNRPTAWVNGLVIVEVMADGQFNCYPVVIHNGRFSYGGKVYGAK